VKVAKTMSDGQAVAFCNMHDVESYSTA
jgi:hypothetical protein